MRTAPLSLRKLSLSRGGFESRRSFLPDRRVPRCCEEHGWNRRHSTAAPPEELPCEYQPKSLRHRAAQALVALAVLFAVVRFAPGLGEVRDKLDSASPAWLTSATAFEGAVLRLLHRLARSVLLHRAELAAELGGRRVGTRDGLKRKG